VHSHFQSQLPSSTSSLSAVVAVVAQTPVAVVAVVESPTELMFQLPQVRLLSSPMAQVVRQELLVLDRHLRSVAAFIQQAAAPVVPHIQLAVPAHRHVLPVEREHQREAEEAMAPVELHRMVAWVRLEQFYQLLELQLCMEPAAAVVAMTAVAD
jgi:hypothetical protein